MIIFFSIIGILMTLFAIYWLIKIYETNKKGENIQVKIINIKEQETPPFGGKIYAPSYINTIEYEYNGEIKNKEIITIKKFEQEKNYKARLLNNKIYIEGEQVDNGGIFGALIMLIIGTVLSILLLLEFDIITSDTYMIICLIGIMTSVLLLFLTTLYKQKNPNSSIETYSILSKEISYGHIDPYMKRYTSREEILSSKEIIEEYKRKHNGGK